MVLTEKEKRVMNALLEEELNYILTSAEANNGVMASYSGVLTSIMVKLNERSFRMPKNRISDYMSRQLASRQLV
jgi:hypothetical protein